MLSIMKSQVIYFFFKQKWHLDRENYIYNINNEHYMSTIMRYKITNKKHAKQNKINRRISENKNNSKLPIVDRLKIAEHISLTTIIHLIESR